MGVGSGPLRWLVTALTLAGAGQGGGDDGSALQLTVTDGRRTGRHRAAGGSDGWDSLVIIICWAPAQGSALKSQELPINLSPEPVQAARGGRVCPSADVERKSDTLV